MLYVQLPLRTKTLDVDALHAGQLTEYDVHSLYGTTETIATRQALETVRNKRALVRLYVVVVCVVDVVVVSSDLIGVAVG